jgi:hypothetical protein
MRVERVGKVSLITVVDVVSRLKAYPKTSERVVRWTETRGTNAKNTTLGSK